MALLLTRLEVSMQLLCKEQVLLFYCVSVLCSCEIPWRVTYVEKQCGPLAGFLRGRPPID